MPKFSIKKDFPGINSWIPFKRKNGEKLTDEQRLYNRQLSKVRIVVEHTFSRMKKFRNRLKNYYDVMTDISSIGPGEPVIPKIMCS
ncbi:MAG: transposase family protein [Conexivisphaerales archaeon]